MGILPSVLKISDSFFTCTQIPEECLSLIKGIAQDSTIGGDGFGHLATDADDKHPVCQAKECNRHVKSVINAVHLQSFVLLVSFLPSLPIQLKRFLRIFTVANKYKEKYQTFFAENKAF